MRQRQETQRKTLPETMLVLLQFPKGRDRPWFFLYYDIGHTHIDVLDFRKGQVGLPLLDQIMEFIRMTVKALSVFRRYDYVFSTSIAGLLLPGMYLLLVQRMLRRKRPRFFAIDIGTSRINRIRQKVLLWLIKGTIDLIFCFTSNQTDWWRREMHFPHAEFIRLGYNHDVHRLRHQSSEEYIFTAGNVGRDYKTLMSAANDLGEKVVAVVERNAITGKTGLEGIGERPPQIFYDLPYDKYLDKMARAKLVVLSLENVPYAAGQMVMLDAMAMGKPLIVSRVPATIDYIKDGNTGMFVSPGNAKELKDKIMFLLTHKQLREKLGRNARKEIENGLNMESMARAIHACINRLSSDE